MKFLLGFTMVLSLVLVNENFCLEILMGTERWSYWQSPLAEIIMNVIKNNSSHAWLYKFADRRKNA